MKYLRQFLIIISISLIGELLSTYISLPVPASVYGLVIMLFCLCSGILKLSDVKEASRFLIDIMAIMFIAPGVRVMESWEIVKPNLVGYLVIICVSTVLVITVAGKVSQYIIRRQK